MKREININIKIIEEDGEIIKFEKNSTINDFMTNVFLEKALTKQTTHK